jgi:branched-chain amino acid transport system permease protein
MEAFLLQLAAGIATGGIYASVALAIVMIYQATHHVNFAQGEMATLSTFMALTMIQAGLPYWVAFVGTLVLSFIMGALVERLIMRPVQHAPILTHVGVYIGMLLIIGNMTGWVFGYTIQMFPSPFEGGRPMLGGLFSSHQLGSVGVTLTVLILVYLFFTKTSLGLAMRAAAYNPRSARLVGIRVDVMLALGWGLAAAIGSVAPNMMLGILLYAFAGALLGGIDNPPGAVMGGFLVGVLENLAGAYIVGTDLKLTVALVIIIGVLVLKPSGLFGRVVFTRV